jgi:hypothetical protein
VEGLSATEKIKYSLYQYMETVIIRVGIGSIQRWALEIEEQTKLLQMNPDEHLDMRTYDGQHPTGSMMAKPCQRKTGEAVDGQFTVGAYQQ